MELKPLITKPKTLKPSRVTEIDKMIHLSKTGKRFQELPKWEDATSDALGLVINLNMLLENAEEKLKQAYSDLNDLKKAANENKTLKKKIENMKREMRNREREWNKQRNEYQKTIGELRSDLTKCKARRN